MRNDSILRRLRKLILQMMHCADGTLKTGKNMVVLGQTRTPSMASFDVQSLSQDKRWSLPQFVIIPVRILTFSLLSYCFQTIASNRRNRYLTGSLMVALHCYNQSELKPSIYNLAALKASFSKLNSFVYMNWFYRLSRTPLKSRKFWKRFHLWL